MSRITGALCGCLLVIITAFTAKFTTSCRNIFKFIKDSNNLYDHFYSTEVYVPLNNENSFVPIVNDYNVIKNNIPNLSLTLTDKVSMVWKNPTKTLKLYKLYKEIQNKCQR